MIEGFVKQATCTSKRLTDSKVLCASSASRLSYIFQEKRLRPDTPHTGFERCTDIYDTVSIVRDEIVCSYAESGEYFCHTKINTQFHAISRRGPVRPTD